MRARRCGLGRPGRPPQGGGCGPAGGCGVDGGCGRSGCVPAPTEPPVTLSGALWVGAGLGSSPGTRGRPGSPRRSGPTAAGGRGVSPKRRARRGLTRLVAAAGGEGECPGGRGWMGGRDRELPDVPALPPCAGAAGCALAGGAPAAIAAASEAHCILWCGQWSRWPAGGWAGTQDTWRRVDKCGEGCSMVGG